VLSNQTVERQGMVRPFPDNYLRRLWREISKRGRAMLYTARDLDGQPVATLLVVHDDRTSYQIVSGVDMTVHNSPAGALLTWRAIRDALNAGRIFDFEGSRIRGVEEYYRRWGGQAHPVWQLNKTGSLRALLARLVLNSFHDDNKTARRSRITSGSHGSVPNTIESGT
jgi:Acetyltransferase (GNAT) domain